MLFSRGVVRIDKIGNMLVVGDSIGLTREWGAEKILWFAEYEMIFARGFAISGAYLRPAERKEQRRI
ncbi:hypothetical protein ABRZ24_14895 [Brenneria populi]|uniref:Uncharacterized protein n=1 Tax=Brenneria populi TaxID=1505588 RepID=A0ABU6JU96_9GAMM|nr:hypothetical protein [Brenneria populi Li et al. 2015]